MKRLRFRKGFNNMISSTINNKEAANIKHPIGISQPEATLSVFSSIRTVAGATHITDTSATYII